MNITMKAVAAMLAVVLLAVAAGWVWGSAGRWQAEEALGQTGIRLHLASARGHLLQARIHLFEVNFGSASRSLESARADLSTVAQAFDRAGRTADGRLVGDALTRVSEAQQLAGRLDQAANSRVADALTVLPVLP